MIKTRPFLKWAGNKFRCIDIILGNFSPAKRLIEPFTGSGAVFINCDYNHYILAEQNRDLITLFQCLQTEGLSFINYCERYFSAKHNTSETYYGLRATFNRSKPSRKRAALFLYLNRHGYNGLCRYNQSGQYNVPFGSYHKPYFPRKEMMFFYEKCQKAAFVHNDFRSTFALAEPGDIIYCDPPYVPLSASSYFTSYTDRIFKEDDQIALAQLAKKSAERNITVIISNHDTPFTRHHYQQADIISFPVKRNISCNGLKRLEVQELVAVFKN